MAKTQRITIHILDEHGVRIAVIRDGVPRYMTEAKAIELCAHFEAKYPGSKYVYVIA
jgi:hypothetical protein